MKAQRADDMKVILNGKKFSEKEVSEMLGVPLPTLRRWRYHADLPGPRWIKIAGSVRYPEAWLIEYLSKCEQQVG